MTRIAEWLKQAGTWIGLSWLIIAAIFVFLLIQQQAGVPFTETIRLEANQVKEEAGYRVRIKLPMSHRTERDAKLIRVYEDGVELPLRARNNGEVETQGRGRYRVLPENIHFSSTDNSPPFRNGRTYTARLSRKVSEDWVWGAFGALLLLSLPVCRFSECRPRLPGRLEHPPVRESLVALAVFLMALVIGTAAWSARPDLSDGFFVVKGMPYSDAMGWNETAIHLKEGRGFVGVFSGHRSGYPFFLGGVFALFGDSLIVTRITNLLFFATGTAFIYLTGAASGGRWLGLAAALWAVSDPLSREMVHRPLTENLTFALVPASILFLIDAFRRGAPWSFAISGALLAYANLSRPLTLLSTLCFGLIFVWTLVRTEDRWSWPQVIRLGLCYSAGILVVLFPWCLRQKLIYGTWSPSINSSALLYAAAHPMGHVDTVNSAHFQEVIDAGIPAADLSATTAYFSERLKTVIRDSPQEYARRIGRFFTEFFEMFRMDEGWELAVLWAGLSLLILGTLLRTRIPWILFLIPLLMAIQRVTASWSALTIVGLSALILLLVARPRDVAGQILVGTILGSALIGATVANFGMNRSAFVISWCLLTIYLQLASGLLGKLPGPAAPSPVPALPWNPFTRISLGAFALILGLGLSIIGVRTLFHRDKPATLALTERQQAAAAAGLSPDHPFLYVEAVKMNGYRAPIPGNTDAGHWSRSFAVREEDRTVAFPRLLTGPRQTDLVLAAQFPGLGQDVPHRGRYVLTGLTHYKENTPLNHAQVVIEVLGLAPYDPRTGTGDWSQWQAFPHLVEVEKLLTGSPFERNRLEQVHPLPDHGKNQ